jgi:hypothetical protein
MNVIPVKIRVITEPVKKRLKAISRLITKIK